MRTFSLSGIFNRFFPARVTFAPVKPVIGQMLAYGIYAVNVSGQFDTENNMQKGTRPVNTRNSETEIYGTNGVHPATSGYLQIADAAYRAMVKMLS